MSDTIADDGISFTDSAAKHGISRERAVYVIQHCTFPLYSPNPAEDDLVMFLGVDRNGTPLEVVAVELDGRLLVIHAMRMRPRYLEAFARVMGSDRL